MYPTKAPGLTLAASRTGRKITLNDIGTPAVLVFNGRDHAEMSKELNIVLRSRFLDADKLLIATVMDLRIAPRLIRRMVNAMICDYIEEAEKELPDGLDPHDYIVLLPDWDGAATKSFGLKNPNEEPCVVVLDGAANVVGVCEGEYGLIARAVELVDEMMGE